MARGRAALVLACALALAPAVHGAEKKKAKARSPGGITVAGMREPSGIAWHAALARLFVVGDDGTLAELDAGGRTLGTTIVGGNLEDVTVHVPSGRLVLLDEARAERVVWDPESKRETGRRALDVAALLGRPAAGGGQGFEGLYFHPADGRRGGGLFYLVHQRAPAAVVAVELDPAEPGTVGAGAVVLRWPDPGADDLTAITYAPALDRMLVIAEARDRVLAFRPDGTPDGAAALPGLQQEGLCVDGSGALWVADDRARQVFRLGDPAALLRDGTRGR